MPHVTVFFDPNKISQEIVDQLKKQLQPMVAEVLSDFKALYDPVSPTVIVVFGGESIKTLPEEIMVTQYAAHQTDVNVAPLEIYIQAGRPKNRSGDKIIALLGKLVAQSGLIPKEHAGEGLSCIFVAFHPDNGFGFIPRHN